MPGIKAGNEMSRSEEAQEMKSLGRSSVTGGFDLEHEATNPAQIFYATVGENVNKLKKEPGTCPC